MCLSVCEGLSTPCSTSDWHFTHPLSSSPHSAIYVCPPASFLLLFEQEATVGEAGLLEPSPLSVSSPPWSHWLSLALWECMSCMETFRRALLVCLVPINEAWIESSCSGKRKFFIDQFRLNDKQIINKSDEMTKTNNHFIWQSRRCIKSLKCAKEL